MQQAGKAHHHNWVRRVEHVVLRVVSFVFSVVSAHAILWFFSSLDWIDALQPWVKWGIAGGFGVLGYFVSRGLAHRLLNRERVLAYLFICGVFELVEVVCNYSEGASSFDGITWLSRIHGLQQGILAVLIQIVLSIIPVVTVMLAWVDMDLERAKQGYTIQGFGGGGFQGSGVKVPSGVPGPRPFGIGTSALAPAAPKNATSAPVTSPGIPMAQPMPTYTQGYTGVQAAPLAASIGTPAGSSMAPGQGVEVTSASQPGGMRDTVRDAASKVTRRIPFWPTAGVSQTPQAPAP